MHIIGGISRLRAEQARLAFELGFHCEVYADIAELMERPPSHGIALAFDDAEATSPGRVLRALAKAGIWLPVIGTSFDPQPERVVSAVKAGALDYLRLPLEDEYLRRSVERICEEADAHAEAWRKSVEARGRIANLSPRERQVLDRLSAGCSNKAIARELDISPRTVEIHRANMMSKLGAAHPAQAVRLHLEALLGAPREYA